VDIRRSKVKVASTSIEGLLVIETQYFDDGRGWLTESYNAQDFSSAIGFNAQFVQDNHSFTQRNVLRGLHYQVQNPQEKLLRVVSGIIFDVVVDLRMSSSTFGNWLGMELSAESRKQLWVPAGLAHGFLVLSPTAELVYKVTDYHHPQSEVCLSWDDPTIAIQWPLIAGVNPNLSIKDAAGLSWEQAPKFK